MMRTKGGRREAPGVPANRKPGSSQTIHPEVSADVPPIEDQGLGRFGVREITSIPQGLSPHPLADQPRCLTLSGGEAVATSQHRPCTIWPDNANNALFWTQKSLLLTRIKQNVRDFESLHDCRVDLRAWRFLRLRTTAMMNCMQGVFFQPVVTEAETPEKQG